MRVEYSRTATGLEPRSAGDIVREARAGGLVRRGGDSVGYIETRLQEQERDILRPLIQRLDGTGRGELRYAAFHEASHAVKGFLDGAGIRAVRIDVTTDEAGTPRVEGGLYSPRRAVTASCYLAGIEGAEMAGLELPRGWSTSDLARARALTSNLDAARAEARRALSGRWGAVEHLARELVRHGYVGGPEAEAIVWMHGVTA